MTLATRRPANAPVEIVRASDAHVSALRDFYRTIWDADATTDHVWAARQAAARENVITPGEAPPTYIALRRGVILGHVTTIPVRVWTGSSEIPAYCLHGLTVLPEHRGGPIGYLVLKHAVSELPVTLGHVVAPPARRLFTALGFTDLGVVPNYVRPLSARRLMTKLDVAQLGTAIPSWAVQAVRAMQRSRTAWLTGAALDICLAALDLVQRSRRARATRLASSRGDASDVDALWRSTRLKGEAAIVRDHRYLATRYPTPAASGPYHWVSVRTGAALAGIAIVREPRAESDPRLAGLRVAVLSDIVPPRYGELPTLVAGVIQTATGLGADALLCSTSSALLGAALRRQGFIGVSGNVHVMLRDVTGGTWPRELGGWWVTRGDGKADLVF